MQLLKHFKELSLHPKNARELKGLILQLAVQGKLTSNWRAENSDVVPASILLEKINKERSKLITQNKIKQEKYVQPLKSDELPFELPESWKWCKLIELSSINGGFAFKSANYIEEGVRVIRISDFDENGFKNHKIVRYAYKEELEPYLLEDKNILIAMTGGTVGKSLFVDKIQETMVVNQRVATIKIFKSVYEAYINCVIPTKLIQDVIEEAKNSTNDNISMTDIKGFNIPLPPLEEQKAIVEVVNQLFAEVEQLEQLTKERISLKEDFVTSALQRFTQADNTTKEWNFLQQHFSDFFTEKTNIKNLRETILQLAVQGKLTAQWRSANPSIEDASELLKRVEAEKQQLIADKKIKKEKPLPPIEDNDKPYELPDGWVWCRLTELVNVGTGSTPAKSNHSYYEGGTVPWYTSSATNDSYAKVQDTLITQKALKETNCKIFPSGSLIIALYGQGKTRGQISELIVPGASNQAIAGMVFFESSLGTKEYLKHFFKKIYHEIRLLAEGGAQPNLNVGKIKNTLVPLPTTEEMIAIVEKVNSLMALCDKLETQIENSQTQIEQLMQSCLKEVFEGKNPN